MQPFYRRLRAAVPIFTVLIALIVLDIFSHRHHGRRGRVTVAFQGAYD